MNGQTIFPKIEAQNVHYLLVQSELTIWGLKIAEMRTGAHWFDAYLNGQTICRRTEA